MLWTFNKNICEFNSDNTIQFIHDVITQIISKSDVNAQIIFTIILQIWTCFLSTAITNNDVNNSEFMQSHNEVDYTNKISILQMIKDEIEETFYKNITDENDLQQLIARYNIYKKLRTYNSDDLDLNTSNLSSTNVRTLNYVNDVTNRLTEAMIAH